MEANLISFVLDIEPQSLQFGGKRISFRGRRPHFFRDATTERYRRDVALLALKYRPREPLSGPVRLDIVFVVKRPLAFGARRHAQTRIFCEKRPDSSNLLKGVEDILTGVGFWKDDGQVAIHSMAKYYAAAGERPCIEIKVEALNHSAGQGGIPPL